MTEEQLQRQIADWLCVSVPDGLWWTAVNPIPAKSKAAAGVSKAMGMKAGAPDLVLCYRGRLVGVELKGPKGSLSPSQRECHAEIQQAGGTITVVRSLKEFVGFLDVLGVQHRGGLMA